MLESMFPSMNCISPVPAVVMQPQTMILPPPCLTVGKAQFYWSSSPGRRHTCWTPSESNKFTLDSPDHSASSEEASFWDDGHANRLVAVWRMIWALTSWSSTSATSKAMLTALMRQKPASAPDAQHKDSTSLIDPCKACSEWNPSCKTFVWPWPLYCNSVPGCYWTFYSLEPGHLCGETQF